MSSRAVQDVVAELARARAKFPVALNSAHEGYAVVHEELDELWDEVKCGRPERLGEMRAEAVQVGAMALRFIEDVCDRDRFPPTPISTANGLARANGLAPTKLSSKAYRVVRDEMLRRAAAHLNDPPEDPDRLDVLLSLLMVAWNDGYEAALSGAELDQLSSLRGPG